MDIYRGVKEIAAKPMKASEAKDVLGREIDVSGADIEGNGYFVSYGSGYNSWSPSKPFEEAYRKTVAMTFGLAIEAMKNGHKVARKGWNGKGIFIKIQTPDTSSKMTHPYIFIDTTGLQTDNPDAPKNMVPWLASQTDMLSEDWVMLV